MVSRPTRVYLASLAAAFVVGTVAVAVGTTHPAVILLVHPGITVLTPQLYLAASRGEDEVSSRGRVRYGLLLSAFFVLTLLPVSGANRVAYAVAASFLFGVLVGYEVHAGYRESSPVEDASPE